MVQTRRKVLGHSTIANYLQQNYELETPGHKKSYKKSRSKNKASEKGTAKTPSNVHLDPETFQSLFGFAKQETSQEKPRFEVEPVTEGPVYEDYSIEAMFHVIDACNEQVGDEPMLEEHPVMNVYKANELES